MAWKLPTAVAATVKVTARNPLLDLNSWKLGTSAAPSAFFSCTDDSHQNLEFLKFGLVKHETTSLDHRLPRRVHASMRSFLLLFSALDVCVVIVKVTGILILYEYMQGFIHTIVWSEVRVVPKCRNVRYRDQL